MRIRRLPREIANVERTSRQSVNGVSVGLGLAAAEIAVYGFLAMPSIRGDGALAHLQD